MDRVLPPLLILGGVFMMLASIACGGWFALSGLGGTFTATSNEMGDAIFQQMILLLIGCVFALVVGAGGFVSGIVLWRRRKAAG